MLMLGLSPRPWHHHKLRVLCPFRSGSWLTSCQNTSNTNMLNYSNITCIDQEKSPFFFWLWIPTLNSYRFTFFLNGAEEVCLQHLVLYKTQACFTSSKKKIEPSCLFIVQFRLSIILTTGSQLPLNHWAWSFISVLSCCEWINIQFKCLYLDYYKPVLKEHRTKN